MRLKTLEIQGFKSFPDRTKLEFNDGITAVIGPNGSGKSNIADAIRWVLGEQSTKTLRGSKMEDVIFGGTQKRKSQGVCSVTLVVDNTSRALPFEMDEVAINRRLYRTGESEYRINGTGVRLKDIYELFMDTGLGRDGYSIIGQGRVAEIVSAKSKERREIFEEAAGISKFRYRKTEAQRRLALSDENILRLKDILSELSARIEPLKKDSEKADKFITLSGDKKQLEVSYWLHKLSKAKERLHLLEDGVMLKNQEFLSAKEKVDELEESTTQKHSEMQQILVEIDNAQNSIQSWQQELSGAESTRAVLENDISHNIKSIDELKLTLSQSFGAGSKLKEQIEKLKQESQERLEYQKQLSEEINKVNEDIIKNQSVGTAIDQDIAVQKQSADSMLREAEATRLAMASSSTILSESQSQLDKFLEDLATSDSNIAQIEVERQDAASLLLEIDRSIARTANEIKGHSLKRDSKNSSLSGLISERNELSSNAKEKQQRAKLLADMDKNMEGFGNSVKYIIAQSRGGRLKGIVGPISSLISVSSHYATAIEIALGGAMQNIVTEDEQSAKSAISMLTSAKAGRATFLPITSVRGSSIDTRGIEGMDGYVGLATKLIGYDSRFEGIMASLLGRTVIAQDLDSGVNIAKKHSYRFRIVTLDGQVINTSGSMTGGFITKSAGILGRQGEIDSLNREAAGLESKIALLDTRIAHINDELKAIDSDIEGATHQSRTYTEDKIRYESEQKRIELAYSQATSFRESAKLQHQAILSKISDHRQNKISYSLNLEELEVKLTLVEGTVAQLSSQKALVLEESAVLSAKLNTLTTNELLCQRDIKELSIKEEEILRQAGDNTLHRQEIEDKISVLTAQNDDIKGRIESIGSNKADLTEKIQTAGRDIAAYMAKRNLAEQSISIIRGKQREVEGVRDISYRELVQLEEAKSSAQTECSGFVASLWEEYELSLSEAQAIAQPIDDPSGVNRQLLEIKAKIKSLGSVNLGAIEEYKEVWERHNFLETQLKDVEKSKAELEKLIATLTEQMCSIFSLQFELINKNFQEIFVELFGGGKASLTLTEPDNILESGIEIAVQPPGKVIKNLASLSGGEQSFVAIAIFFAILKVNPSPFCLMDEIEASLDDVNVAKFAAYLRGLCKSTQFIAITHRRGTMEEADVLYGVTMQEDGISKLLELKVNEVAGRYGIK